MKLSRAVKPDPTALCEIRLLSDRVRRNLSDGPFAFLDLHIELNFQLITRQCAVIRCAV